MIRRLRALVRAGKREDGNVLILVGVLMSGLVGLCGLVIDYGHAADEHRKAQNAADAASLRAAYDIYAGMTETQATADADAIMTQYQLTTSNLASLSFLDSSGASTTTVANVVNVKARVTESVSTYLLGILGIHTVTVAGGAQASVSQGGTIPCVICVLNPSKTDAFQMDPNAIMTISGGGVYVNSTNATALNLDNNASLTASFVSVGGGENHWHATLSPAATTGASALPDPLAAVATPTCATGNPTGAASVVNGNNGNITLSPGTYDTITNLNGGTITLSAGTYCITKSVDTENHSLLTGSGVMLYFTCGAYPTAQACTSATGSTGGALIVQNGGRYSMSAPTSGTYKGLAIFYDRLDSAGLVFQNNAGDYFTGTVYLKSGALTLVNNSVNDQINAMIVVDTLHQQNNSNINVVYTQAANYSSATIPALTS